MASKRASRISDLDEKYFKEIFNLNGEHRDGHHEKRIDIQGLYKIFDMVGFEPNPKQKQEFKEMFEKEETMNFRQFLDIFSLSSNPEFDETDVKNAFRLLAILLLSSIRKLDYKIEKLLRLTILKSVIKSLFKSVALIL